MSELISRREFARRDKCDAALVRRGVKEGRLPARVDKKIDAALAGTAWRLGNVGGEDTGEDTGGDTSGDTPRQPRDDETIEQAAERILAANAERGAIPAYGDSLAKKEHFLSLLRELEFREKSAALVDIKLAERVLFEEFRGARDAWQNFPAKFSALIAADLGVDADRVTQVLTGYVHKQLAALGDNPDAAIFDSRH